MKKKITVAWLDSHEWGLTSSTNGKTHGGYKRKPLGQWMEPDQWVNDGKCGSGLHYVSPENNGFPLSHAMPELVEIGGESCAIGRDKRKCSRFRVVARGKDIPREAWERCGYRVLSGTVAEVSDGERCVAIGDVRIKTFSGGDVSANDGSTVNVETVSGGNVLANDGSTVSVETFSGGLVWAYAGSTVSVETVSGGLVWAYAGSTVKIKEDKRT